MTWQQWMIVYLCIGVMYILLLDNKIRRFNPSSPAGLRVLMVVLWPVAIGLILFFAAKEIWGSDDA